MVKIIDWEKVGKGRETLKKVAAKVGGTFWGSFSFPASFGTNLFKATLLQCFANVTVCLIPRPNITHSSHRMMPHVTRLEPKLAGESTLSVDKDNDEKEKETFDWLAWFKANKKVGGGGALLIMSSWLTLSSSILLLLPLSVSLFSRRYWITWKRERREGERAKEPILLDKLLLFSLDDNEPPSNQTTIGLLGSVKVKEARTNISHFEERICNFRYIIVLSSSFTFSSHSLLRFPCFHWEKVILKKGSLRLFYSSSSLLVSVHKICDNRREEEESSARENLREWKTERDGEKDRRKRRGLTWCKSVNQSGFDDWMTFVPKVSEKSL